MELGLALHAPGHLPGLSACEFVAADELHFSPLNERSNKYKTAQMFRYRDAALPILYGTIS
jgi:hypothetical protein